MTASLHFPVYPTENERLKVRFRSLFWLSLLAATVVHYLVLAYWPEMRAGDVSFGVEESTLVEIPGAFEIPPPPADLPRPQVPLLSTDLELDPEQTIGSVRFEDNPARTMPEPPTGSGTVSVSDAPTFTPYEVRPEFRNPTDYGRALERAYPPMLKDAGIGGTVVLWVFINEAGEVENTRITQSSGYEQLDRVAEQVMREVARFTPALNRDQRVSVWIQVPVTFQTR